MYQFKNGKKFFLQIKHGVVLGSDTQTHTSVSQSRHIGIAPNGGAQVSYGAVSSQSYDITKVWLRKADGSEEQLNISNFPVPVRAGHKLAVIYGGPEGAKTVEAFGAYNISTGQVALVEWRFFNDDIRRKKWGLGPPRWFKRKAFLLLTCIGCAVGAIKPSIFGPIFRDSGVFMGFLSGIATWCVTMFLYYGFVGHRWAEEGFSVLEAEARKEFAKL